MAMPVYTVLEMIQDAILAAIAVADPGSSASWDIAPHGTTDALYAGTLTRVYVARHQGTGDSDPHIASAGWAGTIIIHCLATTDATAQAGMALVVPALLAVSASDASVLTVTFRREVPLVRGDDQLAARGNEWRITARLRYPLIQMLPGFAWGVWRHTLTVADGAQIQTWPFITGGIAKILGQDDLVNARPTRTTVGGRTGVAQFDGTYDRLNMDPVNPIGAPAIPARQRPFSLVALVRFASITGDQYLCGFGERGTDGWEVWCADGTSINLAFSTPTAYVVSAPLAYAAGRWYLLAWVLRDADAADIYRYDCAADTMVLASLVAGSTDDPADVAPTRPLRVGCRTGNVSFFAGALDMFATFDRDIGDGGNVNAPTLRDLTSYARRGYL